MAQKTAGVCMGYSTDKTGTSITRIPGIVSIPEISSQPETIETTTLDNLEYKSYIDGLKDTGGALQFQANDTPELRKAVDGAVTAQNGAESKELFWFISIPEPLDKTMIMSGRISNLGFGGAEINGALQTSFYVTPTNTKEPTWEDGAKISVTDAKGD